MTPLNATCPYCQHKMTLQDANLQTTVVPLQFSKEQVKHGRTGLQVLSWACPNKDCKELVIKVYWNHSVIDEFGDPQLKERIFDWQLRPESSAKPQPDYIPFQLREDYHEACRIRDLSPKASATLSRRCLQGMIRDFWGVKDKHNLRQEIEAIKEKLDTATWEAIDTVRNLGNIGAHMEKDTNLIVSVDPEEASLLLGLIETLFEEWYVAKYDREQKMQRLKQLGEKREAERRKNIASS